MAYSTLTRRRFCGSLIALCPATRVAAALGSGRSAPALPPLRVIRRPCSLRKICEALTRQFQVTAAPDPWLADMRVAWAFQQEPSLETMLGRLAELTDSRVVAHSSREGKRRLTLERKPETARREAAWKRESLSRTIRELLRAVDENERGQLDADSFSANVQPYLKLGRVSQLKYLRLLNPEQTARLLQGEVVPIPRGAIPGSEIERIVADRYSPQDRPDEDPAQTEGYRENELLRIQQYGLGLQINFNRMGSRFYLMLQIGDRGSNVLCGFGDEELGLPLTRTNPYRWLAADPKNAPIAAIPPDLRRPLAADVVLPPGDSHWETALRMLGATARLDVVSDAYLCRAGSTLFEPPGGRLTVARRGIPVGEALDLICRQYGYLWWEKDGCCYCRARSWPWDEEYEVPDQFLDVWRAALARGTIGAREIDALASLTPLQLNGLGSLGGSRFQNRANLDHDDVRQFLPLFRSCTPAQQARLMGAGLLVPPEHAPGYDPLSLSKPADATPHPVLLRLTQAVSMDSSGSPHVLKATMRVTRPEEPYARQPEFTVAMPQGAGELDPENAAVGGG